MLRILFYTAFFCSSINLLAQNRLVDNLNVTHPAHEIFQVKEDGSKDLIANFVAGETFGVAPLTVHFKDVSEGNPTSWFWKFGDGENDTIQHPVHVYSDPGVYSVTFTIYEGTNSSFLTREDYIRVSTYGSCDSLNFPIPGQYDIIRIASNGSGYVSGNNSFGDLAKASYFNDMEPGSIVVGAIFDFGIAKKSFTTNTPIVFKVWDSDGPSNSPGTLLDSATVRIQDIVNDVQDLQSTVLFFDNTVTIDNPFFMGIELSQQFGDTLAIYTNTIGDVQVGNGWEQVSSGDWKSYENSIFGWLHLDHAIYPIICSKTGVGNHLLNDEFIVYPNPAGALIHIVSLDNQCPGATIEILNMGGKLVYSQNSKTGPGVTIDISHLDEGVYILKIQSDQTVVNKKIIISR